VSRRRNGVVALLPVFNDARYLPGWLESVGSRVGAVVALDDGSSDESARLLESSRLVDVVLRVDPAEKQGWNEPENRRRLVTAGQELGADWFVAFDADERPARRLWEEWPSMVADADRRDAVAIDQPLREVWDHPDRYRVDGVWGEKRKTAIFRNLGESHAFDEAQWHGEWYPAQYIGTDAFARVSTNLYHLKMLHAADRTARMRRYQELDPGNDFQSIGYDYLVDETGLELAEITPDADYDGHIGQ
jgi:glycosyltransferase involved in cell wall biosynthesis